MHKALENFEGLCYIFMEPEMIAEEIVLSF